MNIIRKLKKKEYDLSLLVILFVLCIYPLIVRMTLVKTSPNELFLYGSEVVNDSFSYIRGIVIFIVGFIGFINLALNAIIKKQRKKLNHYHFGVGLIFLLITLSYLLSDFKAVAWHGAIDRYEGYYVWVAYLMLFLVACASKLTKDKLRTVLLFLIGSSCVVSIIGIMQNIGINVLNHPILIKLIVPLKYQAMSEDFFYLQYKFAYSTLGNPNYIGSYTAMTLPVIFSLYIYEMKKIMKYTLLFALVLNSWFLTVSFSEAGITAAVFAVIYVTVSIVKEGNKVKNIDVFLGILVFIGTMVLSSRLNVASLTSSKTFLVMVVGSGLLAFAASFIQNRLTNKRNLITLIVGFSVLCIVGISFLYLSEDVMEYNNSIHFNEISLRENVLLMNIVDKDDELVEIKLDNSDGLRFIFANQEYLVKDDDENIDFETYPMNLFNATLEEDGEFRKIHFNKLGLKFAINAEKLYYVNSAGFLKDILETVKSVGLFKNERIGSKRGYIWNRTFPILLKTLLVGNGSDTYPLVFPQEDIGGKYNVGMNPHMIVDKPHNAYLQFWISHGLVSLLICVWLVGNAIISKSNPNAKETNNLTIGLQGAVLGFIVVSLFNDTVVYVTPIFVILLGVLLRIKSEHES